MKRIGMNLELDIGEQEVSITVQIDIDTSDINGSDVILVLEPFCCGSVSTRFERIVRMKYRIAVARRRGLDECTR